MTSYAPASAPLPAGTTIPGGLGGARADGRGGVAFDADVRAASANRMWQQVGAARPGVPMPLPSGDLPAGIHQAHWGEVTSRFASTDRRVDLTRQLGRALGELHRAGVEQVVVGGSYVGTKAAPGDVDIAVLPRRDGAFLSVPSAQARLSRVAPDVHVYPAWDLVSNATTLPGARPGENFLELFLHTRTGAERGAVLLTPHAPPAAPTSGISGALRGIANLLR